MANPATPANMFQPDWQSEDGSVSLICGDCLEVLPTLEAGSIDAVVTDPPYGVKLANHGAFAGDWTVSGDESCNVAERVLSACRRLGVSIAAFASPDLPYTGKWNSRLVWHKPGRGLGGDWERCWLRDWELVLVHAVRPIRKKESSVLRFRPSACKHHVCEKPVALIEYLVDQLGGETILDPFMGSGTTGVACVNLGRKFVGIELERKYFDIAVRRIQQALDSQSEQLPYA